MDNSFIPYRLAAAYLKRRLEEEGIVLPTAGVICGSGLSGLSKTLEGKTLCVKYSEIPGFPEHCSVPGHKGEVVFGMLNSIPAMCFRGRFHSYEGHDMKTVVLPVRVMRCLGVKFVIVTNAAGGINPNYNVGDVICISDHLALPHLTGKNSLVGPNDDELGPRFPPTSNAYPQSMRDAVRIAAKEIDFDFVSPKGGTYCFVSGPMFESRSECMFLRKQGVDCVGMSTVPEIVAAHQSGMHVLCLSLITNKVVSTEDGEKKTAASHAEVLETADIRSEQMQALVKQTVAVLSRDILPKLPTLPEVSLVVPENNSKKNSSQLVNTQSIMVASALVGIGAFIGASIAMSMQRR